MGHGIAECLEFLVGNAEFVAALLKDLLVLMRRVEQRVACGDLFVSQEANAVCQRGGKQDHIQRKPDVQAIECREVGRYECKIAQGAEHDEHK